MCLGTRASLCTRAPLRLPSAASNAPPRQGRPPPPQHPISPHRSPARRHPESRRVEHLVSPPARPESSLPSAEEPVRPPGLPPAGLPRAATAASSGPWRQNQVTTEATLQPWHDSERTASIGPRATWPPSSTRQSPPSFSSTALLCLPSLTRHLFPAPPPTPWRHCTEFERGPEEEVSASIILKARRWQGRMPERLAPPCLPRRARSQRTCASASSTAAIPSTVLRHRRRVGAGDVGGLVGEEEAERARNAMDRRYGQGDALGHVSTKTAVFEAPAESSESVVPGLTTFTRMPSAASPRA